MKVPTEVVYTNVHIHHSIRDLFVDTLYDLPTLAALRARWMRVPGDHLLIEAIENETDEGKLLWQEILRRRITE